MNGKRAKILRHTARMLYNDDKFMSSFEDTVSERGLYQLLKMQYKRRQRGQYVKNSSN